MTHTLTLSRTTLILAYLRVVFSCSPFRLWGKASLLLCIVLPLYTVANPPNSSAHSSARQRKPRFYSNQRA